MECSRNFSKFLILFSILAAWLSEVSFWSVYWQRMYFIDDQGIDHSDYVGLWRYDSYVIERILVSIGCLLMLATVPCVVISTRYRPDRGSADTATIVISAIAGLFILSGVATFSDQHKMQGMDYGSSYYLAVLSCIMAWTITGIYWRHKYFRPTGIEEERLIPDQSPNYNRPISQKA